jgi:speckle-type POZ protein
MVCAQRNRSLIRANLDSSFAVDTTMSFAGVSVISNGKLVKGSTTPTFNAGAASGYHLLVVDLRTSNPPEDFAVKSNSFIVGGHSWRIWYYHYATNPHYAFYTCLLRSGDNLPAADPVKVQLKVSFADEADKQDPASIRANDILEFCGVNEWNHARLVTKEALKISTHLEDNCFTIRCDVVVLNPACSTAPIIEVLPSEMHQNLTDLLLAGEGTDVVFRVSGETFPAHRCILAARSAVFKALLFGPMKEASSTDDVVEINDMEATVFKALLGFIYGDTLPARAPDSAAEEHGHGIALLQHLLVAADRYGLQRLRAMCEKRLCDEIAVGTATTILALAEQHRCDGLKAACYEFLRCPSNLRAVVATEDGFDHLCRSCPPVMKDLILGMLEKAPK